MTLYSFVLFVHVTAVLALFGALSFEFLSLSNLRRPTTLTEDRRRIDPVPGLPLIVVSSVLVTLFSGAYLTARMMAFSMARTQVSLAAVILMGALGTVTGKRIQTIRRVCVSPNAWMKAVSNIVRRRSIRPDELLTFPPSPSRNRT